MLFFGNALLQNPTTGEPLSHEELAANIATFLVAGTRSVSAACMQEVLTAALVVAVEVNAHECTAATQLFQFREYRRSAAAAVCGYLPPGDVPEKV